MTEQEKFSLDAATSGMLDGSLVDDGQSEAELAALLSQDPRARQRYLHWMELHAELLWTHGVAAALVAPNPSNETPTAILTRAPVKKGGDPWFCWMASSGRCCGRRLDCCGRVLARAEQL